MDLESWRMFCSCIVFLLCAVSIAWYVMLMFALWKCARKSTTFILLTSQGFCDIYALSQEAWFSVLSICGVKEETFLPDRWLSLIHGSFELICLPHYVIIALNRSMLLIDPHTLSIIFSKRITTTICVFMWIIPIAINVYLHIQADDNDDGFFLYDSEEYTVSGGAEDRLQTTLQKVFDLSYYVVVGLLFIMYGIAIAVYTCRVQKLFKIAASSGSSPVATQNVRSTSIPLELRLTIVCLFNLVPAIVNTVYDFARPNRTQPEILFYAIMNVLDNNINSILLPLFSQLLRETLKRQMSIVVCGNKVNIIAVAPTHASTPRSRQTVLTRSVA
ncbi:hypothetical protein QR680_003874 [Steinernema hermaphroditum]|uniref:7TM GPCR serpentine receptor class x (Srx) domain-containing protein n=1 Tax=Steinernema hermaphroditum TaxID=289476 RepID=A0AA39HLW1_9BILA|nr:hypothetical protein QR680_003874 [Steinernema hermaphroditum]